MRFKGMLCLKWKKKNRVSEVSMGRLFERGSGGGEFISEVVFFSSEVEKTTSEVNFSTTYIVFLTKARRRS